MTFAPSSTEIRWMVGEMGQVDMHMPTVGEGGMTGR